MIKLSFPILIIAICCIPFFQSCYSFKGTSISPTINTFYVDTFNDRSSNAPPTIGQDFSNLLIRKIQTESRLDPSDVNPDIEFKGTIQSFVVTAEAPQPGEEVSFNRLTIAVVVEYIDHQNEEENWQSRFSFFNDFSNDVNLIDVQEELIDNIGDQLVEDIFNKAFTNW